MNWSPTPQPRKSRVVGPARHANGQPTMAYEALVAQTCAQWGAAITPGQLFSRHAIQSQLARVRTMARVPMCTTYRPLQIELHP